MYAIHLPSPEMVASCASWRGSLTQRVEPVRLLASGFSFRFPALEPALRHVLAAA